jgi:hypothetical protein
MTRNCEGEDFQSGQLYIGEVVKQAEGCKQLEARNEEMEVKVLEHWQHG